MSGDCRKTACQADNGRLLKQIISWSFVLVWMAAIYCFSGSSFAAPATGKFLGSVNVLARKMAHITEYTILFLLCRRAWAGSFEKGCLSRSPALWASMIVVLYALSDEWHQSFVPGRGSSIFDVLIDSLGILAGYLIWLLQSDWKGRKP